MWGWSPGLAARGHPNFLAATRQGARRGHPGKPLPLCSPSWGQPGTRAVPLSMCLPRPRGLWQCLPAGPAPSAARFSERAAASAAPQAPCSQALLPAPGLASLHCTPPHGAMHCAARAPSRLKPKDTLADFVGLIRGLAGCPLALCQLRRGSLCGCGTADLLPSLRPSSQDTQPSSHLPWAGLWPRLSGIAPPGCWDTRVTLPCRGRSWARGSATHCVQGWPPLGRRAAPVLLSHPEGAVSPGCCADPWGARPRGRRPHFCPEPSSQLCGLAKLAW